MKLDDLTVLHPVPCAQLRENGVVFLVDPAAPNWLATGEPGVRILEMFDGRRTLGEVSREYACAGDLEWARARLHVEAIGRDALRQGFLWRDPPVRRPYPGRAAWTERSELSELWIHTNNSCNLSCRHCLVSSGPDGDRGMPMDTILRVISEARDLGARRFHFTGGEPMARRDFINLCEFVLEDPVAELAVLTNGTRLDGARLEKLGSLDKRRVHLQISLDGSCPRINDPIRGTGSFERIVAGIAAAIAAGMRVTVSTAITEANAGDVPEVTRLVSRLGSSRHHLLWLHKRGRAADGAPDRTPPVEKVIEVVREAREVGRRYGVVIDNHEAMLARINGPSGSKRDLSSACVSSLCVYSDGKVYPSAATVNVPQLVCGDVRQQRLEEIWTHSEVCKVYRKATVLDKEVCRHCKFAFLCGGGDMEHSFFHGGSLAAHDPYCQLHEAMICDGLHELAETRKALLAGPRSGFASPVAFTGMGEGAVLPSAGGLRIASPVTAVGGEGRGRSPLPPRRASGPAPEVITSSSECVLSFEIDAARQVVRGFYGEAAETPQADLCCPVAPEPEEVSHIPEEVIERFYGCGSPVGAAGIRPGEVVLDLGCGAGIDVFVAARKVGPSGRAIGVDMTDRMLAVARGASGRVAMNLGYDVVEFREGFLEAIPAADGSADVVTSNCVINLSPDKKRVFSEMWRVLCDGGRIVVSDIVSEESVPPHLRSDPRLWGECISGALTEEEFLAYLERAGFSGLQVLRRSLWKEVEGHRFFSVTVRAFKFEKDGACVHAGQSATYLGPFQGVVDEEGHWFPRGIAVGVCTGTATRLGRPPFTGMFAIDGADSTGGPQPDNPSPASAPCSGPECCKEATG